MQRLIALCVQKLLQDRGPIMETVRMQVMSNYVIYIVPRIVALMSAHACGIAHVIVCALARAMPVFRQAQA